MPIQPGQTVQINPAQTDEETGVSLAGWSGRVIDIDQGMLEIEWDSPTLARLPDEYIRQSIDGGYDYLRYVIEPERVKVVEPTDTPARTKAMQEQLQKHYLAYKVDGLIPAPFAEREKAKVDTAVFNRQILKELKSIQGSGAFVASGAFDFVLPGLQIDGFGELGLPVTPLQAEALIEEARRAPFGQGSKTVTDTSVRSAWEIDAARVAFHNPAWAPFMKKLIAQVRKELGIEKEKIEANLYKLLIYEEGDFFQPHKDSEKEKGMFATLVVGLPSAHTGGELIVRFDGQEKEIDFAEPAGRYQLPYAAFYADCEHEIRPVQSGYRVCLVYNLLQTEGASRLQGPRFGEQVDRLADSLRSAAPAFGPHPQAVLLGHQYTPANYSLPRLKRHDRPRAEALIAAAEAAGYFAKLGLVTHYQLGQLEGDFFYDYNDYYRGRREESSMGEIYEEYTTVNHWAEEDLPGLGELDIREADLLTEQAIGEGKPVEEEEEGYTGNAGMTLEYWYHYGAVFLWPRRVHGELLGRLSVPTQLAWVGYYLRHWNDAKLQPRENVRELLTHLSRSLAEKEIDRYDQTDFGPAAAALLRLDDAAFLERVGAPLLEKVVQWIGPDRWPGLLENYDPALFDPVFQKAAARGDEEVLRSLLSILRTLDGQGFTAFVKRQLDRLPPYLKSANLPKSSKANRFFTSYFPEEEREEEKTAVAILKDLLALSHHLEKDPHWLERAQEALCFKLPRKYVNKVLAPVLLDGEYSENQLAERLRAVCIEDLQKRTAVKPTPPSDWRRKTPQSKRHAHIWELLRPFLSSPTETVYNYRANENKRKEMDRAIRSVTIDLRMETIKKGSPYTLRLTKTQAAYDRALKHWKEDVALLEKLI